MVRRGVAFVLIGGVAGCAAVVRLPERPLIGPEPGRIAITLAPFSSDAARLSFRIDSIEAIQEDDTVVPLRILLQNLPGEELGRERMLAVGAAPEGRYRGVSITLGEASLAREEGAAALRVPEQARRIEVPFSVSARTGAVISLSLDLRAALAEGYRFEPSFEARLPARPPIGLLGYAALPGAGAVLAFNKRTGSVTGVTPVGRSPGGLALDQRRRRLYVALTEEDGLAAVDVEQGVTIQSRPLRGGDDPVEVALTPDGRRLLVVNRGSSTVSFVEPDGLVETGRVPVGDGPRSILIDGAGRRAYVCCERGNRVDVIEIERAAVSGSITTDPGPLRVQLNRQETRLYIIQGGSPHLLLVDPKTLAVTQRIFVGPGQEAIKVDPLTDRLYLARRGTGVVEVFDPYSLLAIDRLPSPATPGYLTIDRDQNTLVAAVPERHEVLTIGLVSRNPAVMIDTGFEVGYVAVIGER